jgi:hypothetical protein
MVKNPTVKIIKLCNIKLKGLNIVFFPIHEWEKLKLSGCESPHCKLILRLNIFPIFSSRNWEPNYEIQVNMQEVKNS